MSSDLMASLTPGPRAPYDLVTSPHLRSSMFERLDKDHFVKAYIQSQVPHVTTYAADGKAFSSTWNMQTSGTPAKQTLSKAPSQHYGFDTPVLKARVARPPEASKIIADASDSDVDERRVELVKKVQPKKPSRSTKPKMGLSSKNKENVSPENKNNKSKTVSKKRPTRADSDDDDHTARLTERRQRKRVKRAIVQPKKIVVSENDDKNEPGSAPGEDVRKAKKGKKNSIPAGFALMHGFTATNVGKNRLTLKPGPSTGVFGKGKASAKTQIVRNASKMDPKPSAFSEFAFLNKTAKGRKQNEMQPNSEPSQSEYNQSEHSYTSISSASTPRPNKNIITNHQPSKTHKLAKPPAGKRKLLVSLDDAIVQQPSSVVNKSKMPTGSPESELWDMELDDSNSAKYSRTVSSTASDQPRDATVVLDTRAVWNGVVFGLELNDGDVGDDLGDLGAHREDAHLAFDSGMETFCRRRSSSICPSESASQYGQPRALRPQMLDVPAPQTTSKYFVSIDDRVASCVVEAADVLLRLDSAENFPDAHCLAIPLEGGRKTPPIIQSDQDLLTAISHGYHTSTQLVAPQSSLDSIEMELRDYADYAMANTYGVSPQYDYQGEIWEAENPVVETENESYSDEVESFFGDPQGGGYQAMDAYQTTLSDFAGFDTLSVEQDIRNEIVVGNNIAGFERCNVEMQDEADIEDLEYSTHFDLFQEDIQHDITSNRDHPLADNDEDDDGPALLTQWFSQGRAILLGLSQPGSILERSSKPMGMVSHAEATVAKSLREHWLPQKF